MVVRFKKKVVKKRGSRTYGYGSPKKHRGKGSKGGKGKAGVGKKAGHKAIKLREMGYGLGKYGFTMPPEAKTLYYVITLTELVSSISELEAEGLVKKDKEGYVIELTKYKKLPVKVIKSLRSDSDKFFKNNSGTLKIAKITKGARDYLESHGWKIEALEDSS
ncbi:MAG: 50S ribosomal protein L15 [Candidatus Nanohaloarchaeota archaeon]|nr:50S ribosomal protein L15 [Candidatus Nanohaloarchaeota archaeon]